MTSSSGVGVGGVSRKGSRLPSSGGGGGVGADSSDGEGSSDGLGGGGGQGAKKRSGQRGGSSGHPEGSGMRKGSGLDDGAAVPDRLSHDKCDFCRLFALGLSLFLPGVIARQIIEPKNGKDSKTPMNPVP